MKIFNRWGQMIYETQDPNINWDGKIQGIINWLPQGYTIISAMYMRRG